MSGSAQVWAFEWNQGIPARLALSGGSDLIWRVLVSLMWSVWVGVTGRGRTEDRGLSK